MTADNINLITNAPAIEQGEAVICPKCHGSGSYDTNCTLCGDSTFDHECNDETLPCKCCKGSGKLYLSPPQPQSVKVTLEDSIIYNEWCASSKLTRGCCPISDAQVSKIKARRAPQPQSVRDAPAIEQGEPIGCMYMGKKFISASSLNMANIDSRFQPVYIKPPQPQTIRDALENAAKICDECGTVEMAAKLIRNLIDEVQND